MVEVRTSAAEPMTVGVIGLGVMGTPIAHHLLRREHRGEVLVHSRREASAAELLQHGAQWRSTPAAVARDAALILAVVPDLPELREVCLGDDGLIGSARAGTIVVVHSTCSPVGLGALQRECDEREGVGVLRLVDAPVSGGEEGAVAGTLSIMVGGAEGDVAVAEPIMRSYGTSTRFGDLGAGQVVKACNQIIVASTIVGLAEAAVVAERAGLDLRAVFEAIGRGYAASRILESKRERFAAHDHSPSGAARFMIKDLGIAIRLLESSGAATEHTSALLDVFTGIVDRGWGDLDTSVAQEFIARAEPGRVV